MTHPFEQTIVVNTVWEMCLIVELLSDYHPHSQAPGPTINGKLTKFKILSPPTQELIPLEWN